MKAYLTLGILLGLTATSMLYSQDLKELNRRRGFKDIKLGSVVDSVKGIVFRKDIIEKKEFPAKLYEVKYPDYEKIGDVAVKDVELKAYKSFIYQIDVTTVRDPKIMKGLEKSYGKATYSIRMESFYWRTDSLSLVYKGSSKEIQLTYRYYPTYKLMQLDKNKKIEEVAEDF